MSDSQSVDLLLVRISREEDKEKVIEMLISELGMSGDEAREKVDNSPNVLSEGISMEQARIIQNRMYPYIDLLPRSYATKKNEDESEENDEDEDTPSPEVNQEDIPSETLQEEDEYKLDIQHDYYETDETEDIKTDESPLVITTAADEVLLIERCHICGRTPTNSQKLAPCRTCGELTCSDCFNRKLHVCEKCVSEGRAVDRPLDNKPEYKREKEPEHDWKRETKGDDRRNAERGKLDILSKLSPASISITAAVLILIAFFLIDPINLFNNNLNGNGTESSISAVIPENGSVPDTILTEIHPDTLEISQADTLVPFADSLAGESELPQTIISLRDIRIPELPDTPDEIALPRLLFSTPVRGIQIYRDSLTLLSYPIGYIATSLSVKIDAMSLVHTSDGYTIFIMSILHPEPVEKRTALISSIGSLLDSTVVDQMVLYYRENDYYDSDLFSFVSDSFSVISQSNSPYFLQRKQSTIPEIRTLVFEDISDWMTNLR